MLVWSSRGFKCTNTKKNQRFLNTLRPNISSTTRKLQINLEIDIHRTLYTNVATFCSQTVFRFTRVFAMVVLAFVPINASETLKFSWMNILLVWTHFSTWYTSQCERIWVVLVRLRNENLYVSVTVQSILHYSHYISIITVYQVALLYWVDICILERSLNPGGLPSTLMSTA
jgi:hypothetical protein